MVIMLFHWSLPVLLVNVCQMVQLAYLVNFRWVSRFPFLPDRTRCSFKVVKALDITL
ncbi:hypothetical protein BJX61DRAFT_492053 [Aspergillus egyptiacus]|nr:hypothetical protein BJX61DRAFT_492053 [Aspergillus egyptiacus]